MYSPVSAKFFLAEWGFNMSETRETSEANILRGALAGAAGGLVASWTMNEFQKVWTAADKQITGGKLSQNGGQQSNEDAENATIRTADGISEALQGRHLTKDEKKKAGSVVRYAFGALRGALYGASVEVNPAANAPVGIPVGAILFAAADEVVLPVLGLSDKPRRIRCRRTFMD